jgi:hypothetical protein
LIIWYTNVIFTLKGKKYYINKENYVLLADNQGIISAFEEKGPIGRLCDSSL